VRRGGYILVLIEAGTGARVQCGCALAGFDGDGVVEEMEDRAKVEVGIGMKVWMSGETEHARLRLWRRRTCVCTAARAGVGACTSSAS
jgi:hypothetical protein